MTKTIEASEVTNIEVDAKGRFVRIGVKAADGARHALELANECLGSLVMTLPRMMQMLTRQRTQDPTFRYVFPLGQWNVEETSGEGLRILTLATPDGFEASFAVTGPEAARLAERLIMQAPQPEQKIAAN